MSEPILAIGIVYLLLALIILFGLRARRTETSEELPAGSVIICACNEEKRLPACLESLENQEIDPEHLEIILVNDASDDRTAQLMDEFAGQSRFTVHVLHLSSPHSEEPGGKWRPLKEGINKASNPALLLTDADAVLPPSWAKKHLSSLAQIHISAGFVLIEGQSIWHGVQTLDWLFIQGIGCGFANLGIPQSAFGKNLSLRHAAYNEVGGLEGVGFSLTEDLALVRAVIGRGGKVGFLIDKDMAVSAPAADTWRQFLQQRKRWFSGFGNIGTVGKLTILTAGLRNFLLVLGLLTAVPGAIWIWCATAAANFLILQKITAGLICVHRLKFFLFWEIFYTWSTPLLALHFLFNRRVIWKGRRHSPTARPVETL